MFFDGFFTFESLFYCLNYRCKMSLQYSLFSLNVVVPNICFFIAKGAFSE